MTGDERQELRVAVSAAKVARVRASGGWVDDREREETIRGIERRLWERYEGEMAARVGELEGQLEAVSRKLRDAEAWIALAEPFVVVPPRPYGFGADDEARRAARRRSWRESKRRARIRGAA